MSKTKVGRKAQVPEEEIIDKLIFKKSQLFLDGKVISKTDDVWKNMANELGGKLSARTLYSKMCEKKFREKLDVLMSVLNRDFSSANISKADSSIEKNNIWGIFISHGLKLRTIKKTSKFGIENRFRIFCKF